MKIRTSHGINAARDERTAIDCDRLNRWSRRNNETVLFLKDFCNIKKDVPRHNEVLSFWG